MSHSNWNLGGAQDPEEPVRQQKPQAARAPVQSSGAANFSKKPTSSALMPAAGPGRKVQVVSNQYRLRMGGAVIVY